MKLHCNGDTISEEIGEEMDTTRPHSELDSKLCHYIRPDDGATDGNKGVATLCGEASLPGESIDHEKKSFLPTRA